MIKRIICLFTLSLVVCGLVGCSKGAKTSGNYKKLNDSQKQIVDTLYSSRGSWEQTPPKNYNILPFQTVDLYCDSTGNLYFFVLTKDVSEVPGTVPSFAVYGTKVKCFKLNDDRMGLSDADYKVSSYYSIKDGYQSKETLNGKPFTYDYTNSATWNRLYSEAEGKDTFADLVIALGL